MEKERCKIKIKPDEILGYKFELTGSCDTERELIASLPEKRKNYLERRTIYSSENSSI